MKSRFSVLPLVGQVKRMRSVTGLFGLMCLVVGGVLVLAGQAVASPPIIWGVEVDGVPVSNGGSCSFGEDSDVEGFFSPDAPPVTSVEWQTTNDGLTWSAASFDVVGANGTVHFYFTVNHAVGLGEDLSIRGWQQATLPTTWYCDG